MAAAFVATPSLAGNSTVSTYTFTLRATFDGVNGGAPSPGGVTLDAAGDLFGATQTYGNGGVGTVYEIPTATNTAIALVTFNTSNGAYPRAGLLSDAAGNLTGATAQGGSNGTGNLFQVSAGSHTFTPLFAFASTGPGGPTGTPVADAAGNLYDVGNNTLFQYNASTHAVAALATFTGSYAPSPFAGPTFDKAGNLFGTTQLGGTTTTGTVYRYTAATKTLSTLVNLPGSGSARGLGGVTFDAAGNLYYAAYGSIFEVPAAQTLSTAPVTATTLYTFTGGADGSLPNSPLLVDAAGDLFGTTATGGSLPNGQTGSGTVFELTAGPTRTLDVLYTFTGAADGSNPNAGLTRDAAGDLFGTTANYTAFELSPAAVPEPAGLTLLLAAGAVLARRRLVR